MKSVLFLLVILTFISRVDLHGQSDIYLQHRKKPNRQKKLDLQLIYLIKTTDTLYYNKIVDYSDSYLVITESHRENKDTAVYDPVKGSFVYEAMYQTDTVIIQFSDILYLKKDLFKNRALEEYGGCYSFVTIIGSLIILPITYFQSGAAALNKGVIISGSILAITLPLWFLGTRKIKYDLKGKWKFQVRGIKN